MRNVIVALTLGMLFALSAQAGDFRIGIVDTERILRESAQALHAQKKIDKEFAVRDQEIKKLAGEIKSAQDELDKMRGKNSESANRIKEREISNLNLLLQTRQREFREDLSLRQNEELAQILAKADKAIKAIAQSEQYDVILQEAVYRSSRVDITDKVLRVLADEPLPEAGK